MFVYRTVFNNTIDLSHKCGLLINSVSIRHSTYGKGNEHATIASTHFGVAIVCRKIIDNIGKVMGCQEKITKFVVVAHFLCFFGLF